MPSGKLLLHQPSSTLEPKPDSASRGPRLLPSSHQHELRAGLKAKRFPHATWIGAGNVSEITSCQDSRRTDCWNFSSCFSSKLSNRRGICAISRGCDSFIPTL